MDPFISHVLESSPLVGVLLIAVIYFHRRDVRNEKIAERRQRGCEDRNVALETRVQVLEDRQFNELTVITREALDGLSVNYQTLMKFCIENELTPPPQRRQRPEAG